VLYAALDIHKQAFQAAVSRSRDLSGAGEAARSTGGAGDDDDRAKLESLRAGIGKLSALSTSS
jgi:hypothetical protein